MSAETESPESTHPETLVRPEDLQAEFGIKKDAYYEDIKFLKGLGFVIETRKDDEKRTLLEPESAALIRELRQHVSVVGQREGFRSGVLVEMSGASPAMARTEPMEILMEGEIGGGAESLIEQARILAAQRMMTANLVVAELAQQMTYDDLTPDLQAQVNRAGEVTHPKANPAAIASQILQQLRAHRQSGAPQSQAAS